MNIVYTEQHFGARWPRESLTQRKYLLILIQLTLALAAQTEGCAHQLFINPFILFNKFPVKLGKVSDLLQASSV